MKPNQGIHGKLLILIAWIGLFVSAMAQDQTYHPVDIGLHIDANGIQIERLSDVEEIFFLDKDGNGKINQDIYETFRGLRDGWMEEHREVYLTRNFTPDSLFNIDVEAPIDVIVKEFSKASVRINIVFTIGHSHWHHYYILLKDYQIARNETVDQIFRVKKLEEVYADTFLGIGHSSPFPDVLRTLGLNYEEYKGQSPQYRNLWFPDHNLEVILQEGYVKYLQKEKPAWVDQSQPISLLEDTGETSEIIFSYENFDVRYIPELGFAAIDKTGQFLFEVFPYDNGPDYPSEGLIRIRENGKIGFAGLDGTIVIPPIYDCAYPFSDGTAIICKEGTVEEDGEQSTWTAARWGAIDLSGKIVVEPFDLGLFTFDMLDLKLYLFRNFSNEVVAKTRWRKLDEIDIFLQGEGEGLFINLVTKKSGKLLLKYLYLPWQDLVFRTVSDHDARIPTEQLVTVTSKAIIYLVDMAPLLSEGEMDTITDLATMMHELLLYDEHQRIIRQEDGISTPSGMQVMDLKEYPDYLETSVATTGSGIITPDAFRMDFPRKMILFHQVPDIGAVKSNWIKPGPQEDVIVGASSEPALTSAISSEPAPTDDIFPDYEPKRTPDTMLDYMPSLLKELALIPEPGINNLEQLITMYTDYRKRAEKNPGIWAQGNIVLGARDKEYQSSPDELILMEIGERIGTVISENEQESMTKVLRQLGQFPETIDFTRFFFIHYDVMGSGRFFYIDGMEQVSLKLQ